MRWLALIAALAAAFVAACRGERESADSVAEPDSAAIRGACRVAADRHAAEGGGGLAVIEACTPLIGDRACRLALRMAGQGGTVALGASAMKWCAKRYCPMYPLSELCELDAPSVRALQATFPRLLGDVLDAEHGEALGTVDAFAFLMTRILLPTQLRLYVRVPAPPSGADRAEVGFGKRGWKDCHIGERWAVPLEAEAAAPVLARRLRGASGDVDSALVEAMVDADEDPRLRGLTDRLVQDLLRRDFGVIVCRNQRRNCPDVRSCP
jgi:hypothetical protein